MSETAKYPYFGVPPARQPRPVTEEPALVGKRLVLSTPEGFVYDMRAAGPVSIDAAARPVVPVITETQHFERELLNREVAPVHWPAYLVWVE